MSYLNSDLTNEKKGCQFTVMNYKNFYIPVLLYSIKVSLTGLSLTKLLG